MVKIVDTDRNGDIGLDEFNEAVFDTNVLFLECMGPVLPSREANYAFLTTFTDKLTRF